MGCFLIGITGKGFTTTGEALLGSVSDDPYDVRTFMKRVGKEGVLSHVGTELISTSEHTLTERGYFARPGETTRGVNEAGLAFTCAMVIESDTAPKLLSTTAYVDITDTLMRQVETVEEAIALFQAKGPISPAYSVLLADASGALAHLEVGSMGTTVYHHYTSKKPGAVFAVNCYLSESLVNYNAPHTLITNSDNNNQCRRERGRELAQAFIGKLDVSSLAQLLSDHQNRERDPLTNPILPAWGYSICNHGTRRKATYPQEDLPWGTVSAEILQPAKKLCWYAYGWPCGQTPEYGDQLFQEHSWGQFLPFGCCGDNLSTEVTLLTEPDGNVTQDGKKWMADPSLMEEI